ncbi:MAG: hypothetical protein DRR08_13905 [Candidatus Parabeggiatoa sp. nov. 2]|nr:MAG: hypothetical protein B6247_04970 [Beggiatoa sp. 4572_84]RKZ59473.1 MAG: hypothetical protein DRR08_13905 [Gammaproteobacteria bacterium]HEC85460.1 helix-turn-helix domain-containing protein [Thioploca sp.]
MLFVNSLTDAEKITLEAMRENHPLSTTRKRAHGILLSNKGYSVPKIVNILGGCRQSASRWIKVWDTIGIAGLIEKHRSGRPQKVSTEIETEAYEKVKENPRGIENGCLQKLSTEIETEALEKVKENPRSIENGCLQKLSTEIETEAFEKVKENPRSIEKVLAEIAEQTGV